MKFYIWYRFRQGFPCCWLKPECGGLPSSNVLCERQSFVCRVETAAPFSWPVGASPQVIRFSWCSSLFLRSNFSIVFCDDKHGFSGPQSRHPVFLQSDFIGFKTWEDWSLKVPGPFNHSQPLLASFEIVDLSWSKIIRKCNACWVFPMVLGGTPRCTPCLEKAHPIQK